MTDAEVDFKVLVLTETLLGGVMKGDGMILDIGEVGISEYVETIRIVIGMLVLGVRAGGALGLKVEDGAKEAATVQKGVTLSLGWVGCGEIEGQEKERTEVLFMPDIVLTILSG